MTESGNGEGVVKKTTEDMRLHLGLFDAKKNTVRIQG